MNFRTFLTNILGLSFAMIASLTALGGDSPDERKTIQGNWVMLKAELGGETVPEAVTKTISLKLDKYEVFVGEHPDRGTYAIDATTMPRSITVFGTEGRTMARRFPRSTNSKVTPCASAMTSPVRNVQRNSRASPAQTFTS